MKTVAEVKTRPLRSFVSEFIVPQRDRPKDFGGSDIPWCRIEDFDGMYLSRSRSGLTVSQEVIAAMPLRVFPEGTVIVSCSADLGRCAIVERPLVTNQTFIGLVPSPEVDPAFLCYYMGYMSPVLNAMASGATIKYLSKKKFQELPVSIPGLTEQKLIVSILDRALDSVAIAKTNAEASLRNASALFESYLHHVFTQRGVGWVEKQLGQIGTTQTGSTPKTADRANYGNFIPFVKPADFHQDGSLDYEHDGLSEQGVAAARKVAESSVLMVCIGATIGKCGFCVRDVTTNQQINAMTPAPSVSYKFVYYQMLTEDFQRSVLRSSSQVTLPIISKSRWSALPVWLPPTLREQEHVVGRLDELSAETRHLEAIYQRKLAALDELKKSILHHAFTGQLGTQAV